MTDTEGSDSDRDSDISESDSQASRHSSESESDGESTHDDQMDVEPESTALSAAEVAAAADQVDNATLAAQQRPFDSVQELASFLNAEQESFVVMGLIRMYNQMTKESREIEDSSDASQTLAHRYLKSSPEMTELFNIISTADKNYALLWRVADVFSVLISTCQTSEFKASGATACQRFLRNFMRQFLTLLLAADDRIKHASLRLMLSITRYSTSLCRDFFLKFNVNFEAFLNLPFRVKAITNSGGAADRVKLSRAQETRQLYMELVLTFLRAGLTDVVLAEKVLRVKGMVSSIFKGLSSDAPSLVSAFLSAIRQTVLQHRVMAASIKANFFSGYVFEHLLIVAASTDSTAELVKAFVLELFSTKRRDSRTTFQRGPAEELRKYWEAHESAMMKLLCLLKANENHFHQQILLEILASYPNRLSSYVQAMPYAFEPRPSTRWLANITLLKRLYTLPTAIPLVLNVTDAVAFIQHHVFPDSLSAMALSRGIQHANTDVCYASLDILIAVFRRFSSLAADLIARVPVEDRDRCTMAMFDVLRRRVPDVQPIFALRSKLLTRTAALVTIDRVSDDADFENLIDQPESITFHMLHTQLLLVLVSYQNALPDSISESRVDVWKLVSPEMFDWSSSSQVALLKLLRAAWSHTSQPVARVFSVRLNAGATPSPWACAMDLLAADPSKAQNASSSWCNSYSPSSLFGNILGLLFSPNLEVRQESLPLLLEFLEPSQTMGSTENEILSSCRRKTDAVSPLIQCLLVSAESPESSETDSGMFSYSNTVRNSLPTSGVLPWLFAAQSPAGLAMIERSLCLVALKVSEVPTAALKLVTSNLSSDFVSELSLVHTAMQLFSSTKFALDFGIAQQSDFRQDQCLKMSSTLLNVISHLVHGRNQLHTLIFNSARQFAVVFSWILQDSKSRSSQFIETKLTKIKSANPQAVKPAPATSDSSLKYVEFGADWNCLQLQIDCINNSKATQACPLMYISPPALGSQNKSSSADASGIQKMLKDFAKSAEISESNLFSGLNALLPTQLSSTLEQVANIIVSDMTPRKTKLQLAGFAQKYLVLYSKISIFQLPFVRQCLVSDSSVAVFQSFWQQIIAELPFQFLINQAAAFPYLLDFPKFQSLLSDLLVKFPIVTLKSTAEFLISVFNSLKEHGNDQKVTESNFAACVVCSLLTYCSSSFPVLDGRVETPFSAFPIPSSQNQEDIQLLWQGVSSLHSNAEQAIQLQTAENLKVCSLYESVLFQLAKINLLVLESLEYPASVESSLNQFICRTLHSAFSVLVSALNAPLASRFDSQFASDVSATCVRFASKLSESASDAVQRLRVAKSQISSLPLPLSVLLRFHQQMPRSDCLNILISLASDCDSDGRFPCLKLPSQECGNLISALLLNQGPSNAKSEELRLASNVEISVLMKLISLIQTVNSRSLDISSVTMLQTLERCVQASIQQLNSVFADMGSSFSSQDTIRSFSVPALAQFFLSCASPIDGDFDANLLELLESRKQTQLELAAALIRFCPLNALLVPAILKSWSSNALQGKKKRKSIAAEISLNADSAMTLLPVLSAFAEFWKLYSGSVGDFTNEQFINAGVLSVSVPLVDQAEQPETNSNSGNSVLEPMQGAVRAVARCAADFASTWILSESAHQNPYFDSQCFEVCKMAILAGALNQTQICTLLRSILNQAASQPVESNSKKRKQSLGSAPSQLSIRQIVWIEMLCFSSSDSHDLKSQGILMTAVFKLISASLKRVAKSETPGESDLLVFNRALGLLTSIIGLWKLDSFSAILENLSLQQSDFPESLQMSSSVQDFVEVLNSFIVSCLKYGLLRPSVLRSLIVVLRLISATLSSSNSTLVAELQPIILAPSAIYDMITSHSMFSSCLLASNDDEEVTVSQSDEKPASVVQNSAVIESTNQKAQHGIKMLESHYFPLESFHNDVVDLHVKSVDRDFLRDQLLRLLSTLMQFHRGNADADFFAPVEEGLLDLLMCNYKGTCSANDRLIRSLLCFFESHGFEIAGVDRPFGRAARLQCQEYQRGRTAAEYIEWFKQNRSNDSSVLFAGSNSAASHYWIESALELRLLMNGPQRTSEIESKQSDFDYRYDSSYMLPLLHSWLTRGSADLRRFVECGAASFILLCLSHSHRTTRAQAAECAAALLDRTAKCDPIAFREVVQIRALMERLRDSIDSGISVATKSTDETPELPNDEAVVTDENDENGASADLLNSHSTRFERVPAVMASFMSNALPVMLRPENAVYRPINQYLLRRPTLDLNGLPLFYDFFFSTQPADFRAHRTWTLRLISKSLQQHCDNTVFQRFYVFSILLSFFDSPLADSFTRPLIVEVFRNACSSASALLYLVESRGFLGWLAQQISMPSWTLMEPSGTASADKIDSASANTIVPLSVNLARFRPLFDLTSTVLSTVSTLKITQPQALLVELQLLVGTLVQKLHQMFQSHARHQSMQSSQSSTQREPASQFKYVLRLLHTALQSIKALMSAAQASVSLSAFAQSAGASNSTAADISQRAVVSFEFLSLLAETCGLFGEADFPESDTISFYFMRLLLSTSHSSSAAESAEEQAAVLKLSQWGTEYFMRIVRPFALPSSAQSNSTPLPTHATVFSCIGASHPLAHACLCGACRFSLIRREGRMHPLSVDLWAPASSQFGAAAAERWNTGSGELDLDTEAASKSEVADTTVLTDESMVRGAYRHLSVDQRAHVLRMQAQAMRFARRQPNASLRLWVQWLWQTLSKSPVSTVTKAAAFLRQSGDRDADSSLYSEQLIRSVMHLYSLLPVFLCPHEYRVSLFFVNSLMLLLHRRAVCEGELPQASRAVLKSLHSLPPPDQLTASTIAHQPAFAWSNLVLATTIRQTGLRNMFFASDAPCQSDLVAFSDGLDQYLDELSRQGVGRGQ